MPECGVCTGLFLIFVGLLLIATIASIFFIAIGAIVSLISWLKMNKGTGETRCDICGLPIMRGTDIHYCFNCNERFCSHCGSGMVCKDCLSLLSPEEKSTYLSRMKVMRAGMGFSCAGLIISFGFTPLGFLLSITLPGLILWGIIFLGVFGSLFGLYFAAKRGRAFAVKLYAKFPATEDTVPCPLCGGRINSGICFSCGTKFCPSCKKPSTVADADHCEFCGAKL
nr:hypothetical protein [Candidatus Sigynarchaeota archaeon]